MGFSWIARHNARRTASPVNRQLHRSKRNGTKKMCIPTFLTRSAENKFMRFKIKFRVLFVCRVFSLHNSRTKKAAFLPTRRADSVACLRWIKLQNDILNDSKKLVGGKIISRLHAAVGKPHTTDSISMSKGTEYQTKIVFFTKTSTREIYF